VNANISSTTKTHLIRGAFYVLLLLSAFVIPLALGQRYVTGSSGGENTLRAPNCTTLSQYDNAATEPPLGIGSQQFEPAMAAFDDQAADDFVVILLPLNVFYITEVRVMGEYSQGGGPASAFNVYLYRDAPGHLPGELIQALLNQPYTGTPPDFTIPLTSGLLDSGTYWISVQAVQNFNPNGQWFWHNRTVQSNSGAAWQNPGDGYGTGCVTWNRKNACMPDQVSPDQVFSLRVCVVENTPTATPIATWTPTATPTAANTPSATPTTTVTPTPSPAGCSVTSSSPPCGSIVVGTPPTDFTVNLSAPGGGFEGSVFMVNGTPANSVTVLSGTEIIFHFDTSPVVEGLNTMHIPAGAFPCGEPGGSVQEFTCTFTYQPSTPTPRPSPTPRLTPSPRSRPTPAPRP